MDEFAGRAGVLCMDDSLAQLGAICTRQLHPLAAEFGRNSVFSEVALCSILC